jgi:hypothetical protein
MLTLKFHHTPNDYWEVYSSTSYRIETIHTEDGAAYREVTFDNDGNEISRIVGYKDEDWSVCYVVNNVGNTIDRIRAPEEAVDNNSVTAKFIREREREGK